MKPFHYERASTVEEACSMSTESEESCFLAGGTTLIDLLKLNVMRPAKVVDVRNVDMDTVDLLEDGGILIGANVRNSDLAWHQKVRRDYQALSEALLSGASPQLRNMATVAGNVMQRARCPYFRDNYSPCNKRSPGSGCAALGGYARSHAVLGTSEHCIATHPSDMCVALAAFEAKVRVEGLAGTRDIPFSDFHLLPGDRPDREHAIDPGELITGVVLPPNVEGASSVYLKSRDRASYEFALASAAVSFALVEGRIAAARIALGGVATKPWRAFEAENCLEGNEPSSELYEEAAALAMEGAITQPDNAYKVPLARGLIVRALAIARERVEAQV
ncbi:xanthine dehydrogenase family protein subunit M [Pelagicoccus sp. SDUM812005]|uniref:FAD binding domain-containing protein n=1 Tax=Pelagicoccus sp. SDUM812005 TaxID=3041257 RepID=UPI00280DB2B2|nr:xanthine dehydrogenase family protein subunit M [Pelagicoccus sp. SDUM812005]MDQ8183283.1 xanthine dehydrogenase family protein subunit M [Pelagicoccus sp. SDUM812005]